MLLKTVMSVLAVTSLLMSAPILANSKVVITSMGQGGVLDSSSYAEEGVFDSSEAIFHPVLHPSGEYVYGFGLGGIGKIDLASYEVTPSVYSYNNVQHRELLVHPNGQLLYVVTSSGVDVVDNATYGMVASIAMTNIQQITISHDGSQLYINQAAGHWQTGTQKFIKLDSTTLAIQEEVAFSGRNNVAYAFEFGMPLDISGNYAVVYAEGSTIRGINISTFELLPAINIASKVSGLLVVEDAIYIQDHTNVINVYGIADGVLRSSIDMGYGVGAMAYDKEHEIVHVVGFSSSVGSVSSIDVNRYSISNTGTGFIGMTGVVIKPSVVDLTLQIQRMTPFVVQCTNDTTGQVVTFTPQAGETVYNCEANGLIVGAGDQVTIVARGNAQ